MVVNTDAPAPNFQYPETLTQPPYDKWITFYAREGRHVGRKQIVTEHGDNLDRVLGSVSLYLSSTTLASETSVAYDKNDYGPFVGAAVEYFAQTGQNLLNAKIGDFSGYASTILSKLSEIKGLVGSVPGQAFAQTFQTMIDADIAAGVRNTLPSTGGADPSGAIFGFRPNPRTDLLFDTQQYREFNMEFLLVPRTLNEARTIDSILEFFQFYMLPAYRSTEALDKAKIGAFVIGFPYEFTVELRNAAGIMEHVNKIGRSVLKSVAIDHAAGGPTAFIKEGNELYPAATRLKLHFQEVVLLARDSPEIRRAGADIDSGGTGPNDPRSSNA